MTPKYRIITGILLFNNIAKREGFQSDGLVTNILKQASYLTSLNLRFFNI